MTLTEVNGLDRDAFVEALGWIAEDSPWVAGRAWERRPFADVGRLHAAMVAAVTSATREEQLALLRAHPDLGTRLRMSDASTGEQAGAGLDRLPRHDVERLQQLNQSYREKFGFPFLFAVEGSTPQQILAALEHRLPRGAGEEFAEALRQVARIARVRLEKAIAA
jgi:2-oxo-4-hydroxy-4-carboxy-5-ureidoimidazoline decarboxylase